MANLIKKAFLSFFLSYPARIESHQYPPDDIPFPALVLCADTPYDEFNVMAMALNRVKQISCCLKS